MAKKKAVSVQPMDLINKQAERLAVGWRKYSELLGEVPHGTARQMAALLELAHLEEAEDVFVDDNGTTWNRPTAEAYYRVCVALNKAKQNLEKCKALAASRKLNSPHTAVS